ncbi:hypothetical protein ACU5JM_08295 [Rhodococcus erythropolis]|uniref:hypothetical protein n=1 Tax=Rhodococcus erythropolis TaxID=1833 RepID=UPI00406BD6FD
MTVVTFVDDVYPHCIGDVVDLSAEELKAIDATVSKRGIKGYETAKGESVEKAAKPEAKTETKTEKK